MKPITSIKIPAWLLLVPGALLIAFGRSGAVRFSGTLTVLLACALGFKDLSPEARAKTGIALGIVVMLGFWMSQSVPGIIVGAALSVISSLLLISICPDRRRKKR